MSAATATATATAIAIAIAIATATAVVATTVATPSGGVTQLKHFQACFPQWEEP